MFPEFTALRQRTHTALQRVDGPAARKEGAHRVHCAFARALSGAGKIRCQLTATELSRTSIIAGVPACQVGCHAWHVSVFVRNLSSRACAMLSGKRANYSGDTGPGSGHESLAHLLTP